MGRRQTIAEHLGAVGDSAFGKFDKKDVELLMAGREYHSVEESCTDSAEEREEQDEEGGGEQPWLLSASKIITGTMVEGGECEYSILEDGHRVRPNI